MEKLWIELSENVTTGGAHVQLVQTENAGRGLKASKDFERDEIIFMESPVILGPPQNLGSHFCVHCSQNSNLLILKGKSIGEFDQ